MVTENRGQNFSYRTGVNGTTFHARLKGWSNHRLSEEVITTFLQNFIYVGTFVGYVKPSDVQTLFCVFYFVFNKLKFL